MPTVKWRRDRPQLCVSALPPKYRQGSLISAAESGPRDAKAPYRGYYYRILTRQGPKAPAGAYSYVINGRMVAGYAMIAYPADYGKTGVMSFVVNHYGDIYEKDLGTKTATVAAHVDAYDPDATWHLVGR